MKNLSKIVVVMSLLLAPGFIQNSWAGPAVSTPTCLISTSVVGAAYLPKNVHDVVPVIMSVNVLTDILANPNGANDVDVTMATTGGPTPPLFARMTLSVNLSNRSNEEFVCRFVNPNDTNDPVVKATVTAFVNEFLAGLGMTGFPGNQLGIKVNSIDLVDGNENNRPDQEVGNTGRISNIMRMKLYVVSPS